MTAWWLAFRYFGSWRRFFTLTTLLAILGMAIGVSSLVVSMAVFSGYNDTLEKTVQDAVGHVLIIKRGSQDQSQILSDITPLAKGMIGHTPFVIAEAILAHKGKITGIFIEGIDEATVKSVLNLKNQIIDGELEFKRGENNLPKVLIGKGIASRFSVKVGDTINLVVPLAAEYQSATFRPKLSKFQVAGIINYGRYDFDSRYVVMQIAVAQDFVEIGNRITGYRLKLDDPHKTRAVVQDITNKLGSQYSARDWLDANRNLFEAAKLEKTVLFFVLMILVIAAAFNIANVLFISVVQRYRDISVLKTLGAPNSMIRRIFICQGLIVGLVGAVAGIGLGLALCEVFEWLQYKYQLIPPEVYKLDHINLRVRGTDLLAILGATMLVCFIATLVPSRRGSKISPVEGLRYE